MLIRKVMVRSLFLKNKKISVKFNGKSYKIKTNNNGVAKFTIFKNLLKKLKIGKKNIRLLSNMEKTWLTDILRLKNKILRDFISWGGVF